MPADLPTFQAAHSRRASRPRSGLLESSMPRPLLLLLLAFACLPSNLQASEPDARAVEFFEKKIRPVLVDQCYKCHSTQAQAAKKLRGGLLLDSREAVLK